MASSDLEAKASSQATFSRVQGPLAIQSLTSPARPQRLRTACCTALFNTDGGGGIKKYQILVYVLYGCSLIVFLFIMVKGHEKEHLKGKI